MIKNIRDIMAEMKASYDKSKSRQSWQVLQGRDGDNRYSMFVLGDEKLWQIRGMEVARNEMLAVGSQVSGADADIKKYMDSGSPVPFGTITPQTASVSLIMAGVQRYSSESAGTLGRELLSSRQVALNEKLDRELERMCEDRDFRKKYRAYAEESGRSYL
ncbi:MAG TPA: hypothetical protein HA257_09215 [Candidatus Methanoperedenaceae archaeon]|nr:hypothetical protein [Candidatus Methanoperedenaceae archaeon]